jgi:hypothetical protein
LDASVSNLLGTNYAKFCGFCDSISVLDSFFFAHTIQCLSVEGSERERERERENVPFQLGIKFYKYKGEKKEEKPSPPLYLSLGIDGLRKIVLNDRPTVL